MARGFSLPILLLLASAPGFGQIIIGPGGGGYPGGGYPGGGYPGRRYPQGGPNGPNGPNQGNQSNATTMIGILRNIGEKSVVIEDDDKNVTTVAIASSTKYLTTSGSKTNIGDFQPGDHVNISAKEDNNKNYKALSMSMVTAGTAEEHSLASLHTDDTNPLPRSGDSSSASNNSASKSSGSSSSGSGNHPTLRRAASSSDDSSTSSSASSSRSSNDGDNDPDRPRLRRPSSSSGNSTDNSSSSSSSSSSNSSSSNSSGSTDGPPRMRRAVSSSDDGSPKAEINPGDSATIAAPRPSSGNNSSGNSSNGNSDSGAPRLRRSAPAADSDAVVADARPSLHADDANGVTHLPAPPTVDRNASGAPQVRRAASGDDVIDNAREAAFSFTETLPNYVVKQFTTRYGTVLSRGGRTSWQALDTVTADVIEENGEEKYKNILVNGKPGDVEKSGSWSKGEFSSLQLDVLSPLTNADFHGRRATTIVNRPAIRFDFSVEQPNSHWHVESEGQNYLPGYTGTIWIDKENYRVLRIELSAQNMPRSFPLDQVESAVDYDYVVIGEGKYLLPVHSEALSCGRVSGGPSQCSRNVIEFRNYKKFTADTSITFAADDK